MKPRLQPDAGHVQVDDFLFHFPVVFRAKVELGFVACCCKSSSMPSKERMDSLRAPESQNPK